MQEETTFLGVALDPRSDVEKAHDHTHDEIAEAVAVTWAEKRPEDWKFFSKRNQAYSLSCMAQSGVKMLGIENVVEEGKYVELSAKPVYGGRANFPSGGMWQQDCLSLLSKPKACLETQLKSQGLGESDMNAPYTETDEMKATAELYRADGYVTIALDMDKIAGILTQGKAVQLMMIFTGAEYWRETPIVIEGPEFTHDSEKALRHGIAVVDFFIHNGVRSFLIEDSAGNESSYLKRGQRIITEDFFRKRCYAAGYLVYKKNSPNVKPQHYFATKLVFGSEGTDVKFLQDILKYEGFFIYPTSTGKMLQITCSALRKWQIAHGINDFANVTDVRQVVFGPKSIALANSLYNN